MKRALTILLLASAFGVGAAPSAETEELGKQLTKLLRFDEMFQSSLKACTEPEGTPFDPRVEFTLSPESFGGISPQSAYWPEVEEIYKRFQFKACSYASPQKLSNFFSERLASKLSAEDLKAAIAFHSSPVGKRIGQATIESDAEFQTFANKLMLEAYEVARKDHQRDIRALLTKCKAAPK